MGSGAGAYMQEIYESTDSCQQSADQMRKESRSLYIDTKHQGTLSVAAYCIKASSKLCPAEDTEQNDHNDQGSYHTYFHISIYILAKLVYRSHTRYDHAGFLQCDKSLVGYVEGSTVYDSCHASCKKHARQCYDKRLDIQIRYQITLYRAEGKADSQCDQHGYEYISLVIIQIYRTAHADKGCHTTHGNINSSCDHNNAHSTGKYDKRSISI